MAANDRDEDKIMDFSDDDEESMLNAVQSFEQQEYTFDMSVQFVGSQQLAWAGDNEPPDKYKLALKQNFGHDRFRPLQWKIIKSILVDKRYSQGCILLMNH